MNQSRFHIRQGPRRRPQPRTSCLAALLLGLALVPLTHAAPPVRVTTTVTMLTDLVQNIGGDRVQVQGLMGPGVDPHLYKATASDVTKLQRADVIFYCGLMLEGKMEEVLTKLARAKKPVYAVTDAIPRDRLLKPAQASGHYDPHVWFDVALWKECIRPVVAGLSAVDPAGKAAYEARGQQVARDLDALHADVLKQVNQLPAERRVLVTSHDAFSYFGRAYGFQVIGLQGISTVSEASLADVVKLVDYIKSHRVPAVFVESSVPHKTIERISKDAGVKIGGELFSDATGTPGQKENGHDLGTYIGMVKHNVKLIVEALK